MKLIPLLLLAVSMFGQSAVWKDYSPSPIRGMIVGSYYCYFWFSPVPPVPYTFEAACYAPNQSPALWFYAPTSSQFYDSWNFCTSGEYPWPPCAKHGYVTWQITPNAKTFGNSWTYEIAAQGPDDAEPIVMSGTI